VELPELFVLEILIWRLGNFKQGGIESLCEHSYIHLSSQDQGDNVWPTKLARNVSLAAVASTPARLKPSPLAKFT
jgi:hypothetical protein